MPFQFRPVADLQHPEIRRRWLPHWEIPGATYLITFRLGDALPAGVLKEINSACAAWLRLQGISHRWEVHFLPEVARKEFRRLITAQEERWLDAGHGSCALKAHECREPLIETLRFSDGDRYTLDSFVIMPNHVHILMAPHDGWRLSEINSSWKKFSARRINQILQRSGHLWQVESFDHIIRDADQLVRCREYIAENPSKARLGPDEFYLECGSGIAV